jgi:hypothetical protein
MGCLEPHWEPPSVGIAGGGYSAVEKFLEDLGKDGDVCRRQAVNPVYGRFVRFVCSGDVDAVADAPWNDAVAFATYYLIFHKRDLETARKALELLKFRNLNDEEEAMLKILELAYAAANPPCGNPEALRRHAEKIHSAQTYGWASVLKALVTMHLTCDPDYKDDVKLALLWAAKRCNCDNPSICYFAYRLLNRIKPLCGCPV